jgi:predicted metal-dependent hydrolase
MDRRTRRELITRLRADAERIAAHFGLAFVSLDAERSNVKSRYGICYDDGTIKIRLNHSVTGEPLKYSSLVNTLCHELAHLRHFNHGPRFKTFYLQMLEWTREQGIYRPRVPGAPAPDVQPSPESRTPALPQPTQPTGPTQLELF